LIGSSWLSASFNGSSAIAVLAAYIRVAATTHASVLANVRRSPKRNIRPGSLSFVPQEQTSVGNAGQPQAFQEYGPVLVVALTPEPSNKSPLRPRTHSSRGHVKRFKNTRSQG